MTDTSLYAHVLCIYSTDYVCLLHIKDCGSCPTAWANPVNFISQVGELADKVGSLPGRRSWKVMMRMMKLVFLMCTLSIYLKYTRMKSHSCSEVRGVVAREYTHSNCDYGPSKVMPSMEPMG